MLRSDTRGAFRVTSGTRSAGTLLREGLTELRSRRRLIRYLVQADMKKRGSDTLFGNLWWILDPLLQMVVYVIFVTIIARQNIANYPLFIMAAILPWKWFSSAVVDSTQSIVRQAGLIRQIAFPKIILPAATATAEIVGFAWGLIPLGLLMLLDSQRITVYLLWIPVIALIQYIFTIGVALLVAVGNVYFRDLGNVTSHLLRLWWLLSPGLYALNQLDGMGIVKKYPILHDVFAANPFATLFEAYRRVIYGTPDGGLPIGPDVVSLLTLLAGSLVFVAFAIVFFKRLEPDFAKVV